jgi:hypothetical protein
MEKGYYFMPMRDEGVSYGNINPDSPSPAIRIWKNGEVVFSSDDCLSIELKNMILEIKGNLIEIKNKINSQSL